MSPTYVASCEGDDAWVALAVDGEDAWDGLCRALGRDDWLADPRLALLPGRAARADDIEAEIAAWAVLKTPQEAAALLQGQGVPAAPVQRTSSLARDPQLLAGGFWDHMERRYVGRHLMANSPWTYDGRRPALRRPAPVLGEHTEEIIGRTKVDVRV